MDLETKALSPKSRGNANEPGVDVQAGTASGQSEATLSFLKTTEHWQN
jgi:hypothetical protein